MKIAENLDIKSWMSLKFRQDQTIHFRVTCPLSAKKKKTIFDFVQSIACVIFIQSL